MIRYRIYTGIDRQSGSSRLRNSQLPHACRRNIRTVVVLSWQLDVCMCATVVRTIKLCCRTKTANSSRAVRDFPLLVVFPLLPSQGRDGILHTWALAEGRFDTDAISASSFDVGCSSFCKMHTPVIRPFPLLAVSSSGAATRSFYRNTVRTHVA